MQAGSFASPKGFDVLCAFWLVFLCFFAKVMASFENVFIQSVIDVPFILFCAKIVLALRVPLFIDPVRR